MFLSQPRLASVVTGLLAMGRMIVLATLMLVFSGSLLGVTISLHMNQVFDRVTSLHAATGSFALAERRLPGRDSL